MLNDVYDVCARAHRCESHRFAKFSSEAVRVIKRYNFIEETKIIDTDNTITVTTSNQAVALIIEHELKDIAVLHGVSLR